VKLLGRWRVCPDHGVVAGFGQRHLGGTASAVNKPGVGYSVPAAAAAA